MKLKLKLTVNEVHALNLYLRTAIVGHTMDELRNWWMAFTVISAVKEIYDRTDKIVKDYQLFPVRQDYVYSLTLTRTQALALACTTLERDGVSPIDTIHPNTYERAVIDVIVEQVRQVFIV